MQSPQIYRSKLAEAQTSQGSAKTEPHLVPANICGFYLPNSH